MESSTLQRLMEVIGLLAGALGGGRSGTGPAVRYFRFGRKSCAVIMNHLRIGVPSKGRLAEQAAEPLGQAGLRFRRQDRQLETLGASAILETGIVNCRL